MRKQCRQDVNIYNANDPLTLEIIQALYATPNKRKEIANRFNVSLEIVMKIYKTHLRGRDDYLDNYNAQKVLQEDKKNLEKVEYPEEPEVTFNEINTEPKEENNMGKKKKHGGRAALPEETVLNMVSDAESSMNLNQVARKYGVSWFSVNKYCKAFGIKSEKGKRGPRGNKKPTSVPLVTTTKDSEEIMPPTLAIKKIKFAKVVRVGLIDDRHDMPVDDYIFNNVPNDKLFDYEWYDQTAYEWLSEHVSSGDSIIVYCTGLTAAVTSVQKQCERLNIPLTFAHFNNDNRDYCYQKITGVDTIVDSEDGTETVFKPNFARIYKDVEYVNLVECTLESIEKNKKFYGIQCQEFTGARERIGVLSTSLVDCFDMIWKVYPMYIKQAFMNSQKNLGVYVSEYNIREDGYIEIARTISKSYNYK